MTAFASDNYAGALPEVLAAVAQADALGHVPAYGADPVTQDAVALVRAHLGEEAQVFFVWGGTAANVLCLESLAPAHHQAIVCAESAHIYVDEGGAPERLLARKLLPVATPDGKLTPELVAPRLVRFGDEHAVQPKVLSITQSTELGTRYARAEIRALADLAHEHDMLLHLDGARIMNAAAADGCTLREATRDLGVDALSLGITKNGGLGAEAVVLFDEGHADGIAWRRKAAMQLASKQRYLSAQVHALLTDDRWRLSAAHANAMAARLAAGVTGLPGVRVTQEVQANAVFAIVPERVREALWADGFLFYVWDELTGEVRWMCSWDTTEDDVDGFVAAIARHAAG
ncbi:threonine aldolase [Conexibacter sp. W3-3-2]|uniref:threonine aldolase family protein n=1 Tax=Conexibacter sp. W3-3-2 TaxID=2675227 RepID=UPI0013291112|nr:beta-eliminating lyase-related protein [Conexibacter sp. W3-3-2]MTD43815.1 threonine aldolase [Conexibacter sp. W3-3-2]